MHELKGAIFSLRDVLVHEGKTSGALLNEAVKLMRYLISVGVQPVLVSNSAWVIGQDRVPFQKYLSERVGAELPFFCRGVNGMPAKQRAEGMAHVLASFGWSPENAVYVGSTDEDMQAAKNGTLLFLNAQWHAVRSPYGFAFDSPKDVARFIDCCCLGLGDWFWGINDGDLSVYSIAPLAEWSTRYPQAAVYSSDAKQAVKYNRGNLLYWGRLMAARIYFSGLGRGAHYVSPYPGHSTESKSMLWTNSLKIVAGSLNAQYLGDLLVRHSTAPKSQGLRNAGATPTHGNQLSTLVLRPDPLRTGASGVRYKNTPLRPGRRVMVVDDVCTEGYSLEAARVFIKATGAQVALVTWLKTPGRHYSQIESLEPSIGNPYAPYVPGQVTTKTHGFDSGLRNRDAPTLIGKAFERYSGWDWPSGI